MKMKIPSSVMGMEEIETSMERTPEKLKFLLNHRAEHNEEHKKSFVTAVNLAKAVDATDEATKYLKKGLKSVEDG